MLLTRVYRIAVYSITSVSLLYMTYVLLHVVRDLLLRVGFTDVLTLGGLLDQISALPMFSSVQADAIVFLVGAGGWLLIRRDCHSGSNGKGNGVRAFFLAGLAALLGLLSLLSVLVIVFNVDTLSQHNLPIAAPAAGALSWGVTLVAVLGEWRLGGWRFDNTAQRIAMFFAYLGQWILAIFIIWSVGSVVQSILQRVIAPLPLCSPQLDITAQLVAFIQRLSGQCTDVPPLASAILTAVAVGLTLAVYVGWGRNKDNKRISTRISNLDAVVGVGIGGFFVTLNSVLGIRLLLDLVTRQSTASFPRSLLSSPGSVGIDSYPFVGPLVAGACLLAFYYWRKRREVEARESDGLLYGLMTISFPLGAVFFVGACALIGDIFVALLYNLGVTSSSVTTDDWSVGFMLVIPGFLLGSAIWRDLHRMGWGNKAHASAPRRIYVTVFYLALLGAAGISLFCFLALVITALLHTPIDPTNSWAPRMLAVTLVTGLFARFYYRGLWERL